MWMIKKWWFLVIFDRSDWSSGRPRCNIVDGGASMRRRHLIGRLSHVRLGAASSASGCATPLHDLGERWVTSVDGVPVGE